MGIISSQVKYTTRERFLNVFQYREVDHVPDVEFGYWTETLRRWHNEGLPRWVTDDTKANAFFGFEGRRSEIPIGEKVPLGFVDFHLVVPFKRFKREVLKEDERTIVIRDEIGVVSIQWKYGVSESIPRYLEFPVKDRDSWEEYKARFDLDGIEYPKDWEVIKERYVERTYPLGIDAGGYFGWARSFMGLENLCVAFYKDPDLIRDIFRFRTEMVLKAIGKAVREVKPKIDFAHWWEDMAYNKGPLISPRLVKEFMVPEYKRVTSFLKDHGIWINILDCDGNINSLVPLWLEAGINCMFPLERRAGTDPIKLREIYGKKVLLMGGVDKTSLIRGRKAISEELKRLEPLVDEGGYIPHVDHRVPPDIPYETYLYYLREKRKIIFKTPIVPFYYFNYPDEV
jgi:uroporphyrinogen decarboxylase